MDLSTFNAFVLATGARVATDPDRIINDAVKNTYFLSRALKGRDASLVVQSGSKIIERVQLTDSGTFEFIHPNEDLDIQNVDNLTPLEIPWRFGIAHYAYNEAEMALNGGDPQTYYKNLLKGKRQACETSTFNGMEDAIWAAPSNADQEALSGKKPYSIPCFITSTGGAPSGFTTIQTVNPSVDIGFKNQVQTYDASNMTDPDQGLVAALDEMWLKIKFEAPQGGPAEYFEDDNLQKMVIASNRNGIRKLQQLTRDSNDRLMPAGNLGWVNGNITYAGIPLLYVTALDTALVNSGAAITVNKPWFYFINLNYLYPVYHSEKYMVEKAPMQHPRQPLSYVVWKYTMYNWIVTSRKRQGLVLPTVP